MLIYTEYYPSLIVKKAGLNIISCDLSMCALFTDFDTSFVQIYDFVGSMDIVSVSKYLRTLGESFYNDFVDMIIFDCLIIDQDRHYGNFGLLVDSKTNKLLELASYFITDRQKVWLKKLINFKFEKHKSYNLPSKAKNRSN